MSNSVRIYAIATMVFSIILFAMAFFQSETFREWWDPRAYWQAEVPRLERRVAELQESRIQQKKTEDALDKTIHDMPDGASRKKAQELHSESLRLLKKTAEMEAKELEEATAKLERGRRKLADVKARETR